jgi:anti-anti-sigma factor
VSEHPSSNKIFSAHRGSTFLIQLRGILGPEDCDTLSEVVDMAEASPARSILLDLQRLISLDAACLHTILRASRRSAASGGRLQVTRGTGHVSELFRMTALDRTVQFADDGLQMELGS